MLKFNLKFLYTPLASLFLCLGVAQTSATSLSLQYSVALDNALADPHSNFHPQGLGYDTGSNELLFMQQSTSTIFRTDLLGNITGSRGIGQVTVRPDGQTYNAASYTTSVAGDGTNYYFTDYTNNAAGYDLYSIGKASGSATNISSEVAGYGGYPIDVRDGMLYRTQPSTTYNWNNLNEIRVSSVSTPDTVVYAVVLDALAGIGDIAVDSARNSIWTIDYAANANLNRFDLATGLLLETFALGLDGLTAGLTYADDTLYYYDWNNGSGSTLSAYSFAAVPVPAALPLLATALAGLAFAGRRARRRTPAA